MAAQAQRASFYPAITGSKILVKAGETKIPGDEVGGKESILQTVGAIFGWNITESTGLAKAKIRLWDGTSGSEPNTFIATISLSANSTETMSGQSIQLKNNAVFIEIVSGSIEGTIYYG